ncbi:hypothetical protein TWF481_007489 [Arthrobotrys musiformis]|uniref:Uncharacterized protein n=1 Tax=Arthrobotrys musiformis TaxID=47236 RepID=A0AAV9WDK3_9PEZI
MVTDMDATYIDIGGTRFPSAFHVVSAIQSSPMIIIRGSILGWNLSYFGISKLADLRRRNKFAAPLLITTVSPNFEQPSGIRSKTTYRTEKIIDNHLKSPPSYEVQNVSLCGERTFGFFNFFFQLNLTPPESDTNCVLDQEVIPHVVSFRETDLYDMIRGNFQLGDLNVVVWSRTQTSQRDTFVVLLFDSAGPATFAEAVKLKDSSSSPKFPIQTGVLEIGKITRSDIDTLTGPNRAYFRAHARKSRSKHKQVGESGDKTRHKDYPVLAHSDYYNYPSWYSGANYPSDRESYSFLGTRAVSGLRDHSFQETPNLSALVAKLKRFIEHARSDLQTSFIAIVELLVADLDARGSDYQIYPVSILPFQ